MLSINLDGQTSSQYEIEALVDRYGTQEWSRTSHGYFDNLEEARRVAEGMGGYTTRIALVETKRTVVG